ncbi:ATP-binding cassette domain-containing protein [Aliarcobacter butzleri]|uniref:ATP-binding cassette domain-containing protein n=1 Tax=Aliarcobacter butzleri TaxID=28197 RepID=UPI002B24DC7E|nr:ATP-binding cassette domain-containing protein [Aliarcobacter butzleri]
MLNIKKLQISSQNKMLVNISFEITKSCALIGESGSGKSLTLKALLNLLPSNLKLNKEIDSPFELNYDSIGFIPQNPFTSLSSMTKIKNQFFCREEKKEEVLKLLDLDKSVLNKFPSQLSGGQIQRVIIAIALSRNIKLLLLDEPTTALDIENKNNIINIVNDLKKQLNILILFVTHDIESIRDICESIVILRNGEIVEKGLTKDVLSSPKDEYTRSLINSTFKNKDFRI